MGMFGRGGFFSSPTGRNVLGSVGDGLLVASGNKPMYWPQQAQANHEAQVLQREMALAQYKAQHPDPTSLQRNYEYLQGAHPDLAEQYLRAEANPMTLMTDPATGAVTFQPKGGPATQAPVSKTLPSGQTAYWVNGAWYDNPEGR